MLLLVGLYDDQATIKIINSLLLTDLIYIKFNSNPKCTPAQTHIVTSNGRFKYFINLTRKFCYKAIIVII